MRSTAALNRCSSRTESARRGRRRDGTGIIYDR